MDCEQTGRLASLKRISAGNRREMPVPGDRVDVRILEDGGVLLDRLHPRTFELARRTAEGRSKIMAANVDTMAPVVALAQPEPRALTLDRLLAFAELADIESLILFTKPDLAVGQPSLELRALYDSLGYRTLTVNPKTGENLAALREQFAKRHTLLCGVSGVGKSSIFRALGGEAVVGEVSRHGRGRQTTTTARLYRMADGFLIDSPGVAEFGLGDTDPATLVHGFREFVPHVAGCRFSDCSHLQEPGCGLRQAVQDGAVAASRYASYAAILKRSAAIGP